MDHLPDTSTREAIQMVAISVFLGLVMALPFILGA
ncbi:diguanylate cyclase/phosphodiesterase [Bacteriophage Eos]|nr:diguanylate cyclase/phosphodiesterase [Bacteriophage Eos]